MEIILKHEDPDVQRALGTLSRTGLNCIKVAKRGDAPGGWVLQVDGTQNLAACRDALLQAAETLQKETGTGFIHDLMCDGRVYDKVLIFPFGKNFVTIAITKAN